MPLLPLRAFPGPRFPDCSHSVCRALLESLRLLRGSQRLTRSFPASRGAESLPEGLVTPSRRGSCSEVSIPFCRQHKLLDRSSEGRTVVLSGRLRRPLEQLLSSSSPHSHTQLCSLVAKPSSHMRFVLPRPGDVSSLSPSFLLLQLPKEPSLASWSTL